MRVTTPNPMGDGFEQLQKTLKARAPKGFRWDSARYPDEDHGSTVLRAHYAGLRTIFADWQDAVDPRLEFLSEAWTASRSTIAMLSERYGYQIPPPENILNRVGYGLMGDEEIRRSDRRVPAKRCPLSKFSQRL